MSTIATYEEMELVRALPRLRRFAVSLTRNTVDADDLVQDTCQRALARQAMRPAGARFESWLFTLMRNMWIDEVRKRKVRLGQGVVDATEHTELKIGPSGEDAVYAHQARAMIARLPVGLASVFLLVNVEGHSYREAASILGIPIGTVMSRLSAARLRLAAMLGTESYAA
jgi:RNA polymerase sigma-70 factor (ECF subfamily)